MCFKDPALYVFDLGYIEGVFVSWKLRLARERSCHTFLYLSSSHAVYMNKWAKKFPHNVRQADSFARSHHSKVVLQVSESAAIDFVIAKRDK